MNIDPFAALGDPTRRQVVESLRQGARAVNEIVAHLSIHQSGVSRHLRILRAAGFVEVRPLGQQRLYSLRPERFREMESWLAGYQALWSARLERFDAAVAVKQAGRPRSPTVRRRQPT